MAAWINSYTYGTAGHLAAKRASAIKKIIYAQKLWIFTARKVEDCSRYASHHISFVITLRYRAKQAFEDRIRIFHAALAASITNEEQLLYKDNYFCVQGEQYTVNFVLEAYTQQASRIGYFEDGQPKFSFLQRMGVDFAFRRFHPSENFPEWRFCWQRMNIYEFIKRYPNPADRLIASIALERRLKKLGLRICYGSLAAGSGGYFTLYPINIIDRDSDCLSYISFTEEVSSLLLPIIHEFYPYIYDRYYDDKPLSHELWSDVIAKMRELTRLVVCEPLKHALNAYVERANISVLQKGYDLAEYEFSDEMYAPNPDWLINRKSFLYKNRQRLFGFFSFFAEWLENQGQCMINIAGP